MAVHARGGRRPGTAATVAVPRRRAPRRTASASTRRDRTACRCCASRAGAARRRAARPRRQLGLGPRARSPSEPGDADLRGSSPATPSARWLGCCARGCCTRTPTTSPASCPTFELGRKAGLGLDITADDEAHLRPRGISQRRDRRAAGLLLVAVRDRRRRRLPVAGDAAAARPLPPGIGVQPDRRRRERPGRRRAGGTTLPLAGALRPVGSSDRRLAAPDLQDRVGGGAAPVLNAPADGAASAAIRCSHRRCTAARRPGWIRLDPAHPARWFEQLNLSPDLPCRRTPGHPRRAGAAGRADGLGLGAGRRARARQPAAASDPARLPRRGEHAHPPHRDDGPGASGCRCSPRRRRG